MCDRLGARVGADHHEHGRRPSTRSTFPSARLRRSACSSRPSPWTALTSVPVMISMFGRDSMRVDEVARHRRREALAADDDADAARRRATGAPPPGRPSCRRRRRSRPRRGSAPRRVGHGGVVDAGAGEALDVVRARASRQRAPVATTTVRASACWPSSRSTRTSPSGPRASSTARWKLDSTASKRRACSVALRVRSVPEMPVGKPR